MEIGLQNFRRTGSLLGGEGRVYLHFFRTSELEKLKPYDGGSEVGFSTPRTIFISWIDQTGKSYFQVRLPLPLHICKTNLVTVIDQTYCVYYQFLDYSTGWGNFWQCITSMFPYGKFRCPEISKENTDP